MSAAHHMSRATVLHAARAAFERYGRIPYDQAVQLMKYGYIVSQLEDYWARGRG
jgi:hypothetical protein